MSPESHGKKEAPTFTPQQRVQAVLAIWTERRRPVELCRELAISDKVLSQWEKRALSGMLKALDAQTRLEAGPTLSPKLERLLAQQVARQTGRMARLEKRLVKLQDPKAAPPPPK